MATGSKEAKDPWGWRMKLLWLIPLFCLAIPAHAQTSAFIGVDAGSSLGNLYVGVTGSLESTVAKHYEFDLKDTFAPLEEHIKLGSGWANLVKAGPTIWLTPGFGLNGAVSYSGYKVAKAHKALEYAYGGVSFKKQYQDKTRVQYNLDYIQEFNNGIFKDGTETSLLKGGNFEVQVEYSCLKHFCYFFDFNFGAGHVREQGNPVCDGSGWANPQHLPSCTRTGAWGGSATGAFELEFPGHE